MNPRQKILAGVLAVVGTASAAVLGARAYAQHAQVVAAREEIQRLDEAQKQRDQKAAQANPLAKKKTGGCFPTRDDLQSY